MRHAVLCAIMLGLCVVPFFAACRTTDRNRRGTSAFKNAPVADRPAILSEAENEVLLLLQQVEELRRIRDAHSKYYQRGDNPAAWTEFVQGLDLGVNRMPDSETYLTTLHELKALLELRLKAFDAQIKRIKEDLTTHRTSSGPQ